MRRASRDLLQVLTLASDGEIAPPAVAENLGIDVEEADGYLAALRRWGFVDLQGRITADGRRELAENKRGLRRTTAYLQGVSDPYYPLSLR
jgi:predicted transcriptional regulator